MNTARATGEEKLASLVEKYDLAGLIEFSQHVPEENIGDWHDEVMESGFLALFAYLSYDQACDKLGEGGLDLLDEVVTATEMFHGSPLRQMRAEVLNYRLQDVIDIDTNQAKEFALQAIQELSLETTPNPSILKFRASLYHQLAQLDFNHTLHYWQLAIEDLKTAEEFNLRILYHTWKQPVEGMPEARKRALDGFNHKINKYLLVHPNKIWELLDEGVRTLANNQLPDLERQVSEWLQNALAWKGDNAEPRLLREAGLLLHRLGKAQQRADCFAKSIECFERFIGKDLAHAMEVNYIANVLEDWAALNEKQGVSGTDYLAKAWEVYRKNNDIVRINFSPLLHYAEFLERLYFNQKIDEKPTKEQVIALALEAEEMGDGYYSGPGMIQARMAIYEGDAPTAIHHLCRLLLRHELCIDSLIKSLRESLKNGTPVEVKNFLDEAIAFMDEVSEGYYYNPSLSMADLNKLNRTETIDAWQQRMEEIRSRRASE